jgi:hypothetical protein
VSRSDSGSSSRHDSKSVVPCSEACEAVSQVPSCPARSQSERGLDSAEWSPAGDPEARVSGKSAAQRSEQRETSGVAELSMGWRGVAAACHAQGGQHHE